MKRTLLAAIAAVTFAVSLPAIAADATSATYITEAQAFDLLNGLSALDFYNHTVMDGDKAHVVQDSYKLGGGLRLLIAHDEAQLRPIVAEFETARNALVKEYANGAKEVPDNKKSEYQVEVDKMRAKTHGVVLKHIKAGELCLPKMPNPACASGDENPVAPGVLSLLDPILDQ